MPASQATPQRGTSRSVKQYDFRSPDKFSKDRVRAFQSLHDGFAQRLGSSWSAYLRSTVRTRITSVDQVTYGEFVRGLPDITVIAIFSAPPLSGVALLEIHPDLAFPMIDRLLGGTGQPLHTLRALTEIERTLAESLIQKALGLLAESWQDILELQPLVECMKMNLTFTPVMAENEAALRITMEVSLNDKTGRVCLLFPATFLEGAMSKFSAQAWMNGANRQATPAETWQHNMRDVPLSLTVCLGRVNLPLRELTHLQVGDVIPLSQDISQPIPIVVDQAVKFLGRVGTLRRNLAVVITDVVQDEESSSL